MQKIKIIYILIAFFIFMDCNKSYDPIDETSECNSDDNPINFTFKYGVTAKNILNTSDCTYQKDLILDPPIITHLKFTREELNSIFILMQSIDFFNYPDTFQIHVPGDTISEITPSIKYYYDVKIASLCKELYWNDSIIYPDTLSEKLRYLNNYIINIIVSKETYKALPEPRGGYD
jgi:hypothetical protein